VFYHYNNIDPFLINKHAEINYHIKYRLIIREGVRTFIEPELIINNHYNNYQEAACYSRTLPLRITSCTQPESMQNTDYHVDR
jgi:hypothetical protein